MAKKYTFLVLTVLITAIMFNTIIVFATDDITSWTEGSSNENLTNVSKQMEEGGRSILNLVETFGRIAGLIVLLIYGIKWFLSRNDSSARKELKDNAVGYVVGAIVFFGAIPLYKIIYSFAKSFG